MILWKNKFKEWSNDAVNTIRNNASEGYNLASYMNIYLDKTTKIEMTICFEKNEWIINIAKLKGYEMIFQLNFKRKKMSEIQLNSFIDKFVKELPSEPISN